MAKMPQRAPYLNLANLIHESQAKLFSAVTILRRGFLVFALKQFSTSNALKSHTSNEAPFRFLQSMPQQLARPFFQQRTRRALPNDVGCPRTLNRDRDTLFAIGR